MESRSKTFADYQKEYDDEYYFENGLKKCQEQVLGSIVYIGFAYFLKLCGKNANGVTGADGKVVGQNTYTMAHTDINVFFFTFIAKTIILYHFAKIIKTFGKVKNTYIRNIIILPVLFVVRLAILVYFFYFMGYKDFVPHIKIIYSLNNTNWWKSDDESFLTNCSPLNALLCWFWWLFAWAAMLYFGILFGFICLCILVLSILARYDEILKIYKLCTIPAGGGPLTLLYYYFGGFTKY